MFSKKKNKDDQDQGSYNETLNPKEDKSKKISKNVYTIYLKEKVGDTVATFAVIKNVKRWFEDDSEIPFLRNDKAKFLEVMPEQEMDYLNLDKGKILNEINMLRSRLKAAKDLADPAEVVRRYGNPKNMEFKLLTLEAKLRALKYSNRAYMTFGPNGEKEFTFIREGSHFIPQAVDNETYTAFYPPDSKKKTFAFTHRNKQDKHGMGRKFMTAALAGAWIFGLIFLFGTAYFMMQAWGSYSDSEINQAKEFCVQTAEDLVRVTKSQAVTVKQITDELEEQLQPKSSIEGVQPK